MNRTKIEWAHCFGPGSGFTWNPIVGCTHGCPYCYARRQAKRQKQNCQLCYEFTPHLHPERMNNPLFRRKPAGIFIGSMCDLYDPNVPQEWRDAIWANCGYTPQHRYFVLTKQPQNIVDAGAIPGNVLLGFSCHDTDTCLARGRRLYISSPGRMRMVSIEPLLGRVEGLWYLCDGDWAVIGAQTGTGALVPPAEWVDEIVRQCSERDMPCFVKDNLRTLYPERDWPQEWPEGLTP